MKRKILVLIFLVFILGATQSVLNKGLNTVKSPCAEGGCRVSSSASSPNPSVSTVSASVKPQASPRPSATPVYSGYCVYAPVLYYHHIQPQSEAVLNKQTSVSIDNTIFEGQMAYINSHGYKVIGTLDLVNALRTRGSVPAKNIAVTIDDGYSDLYTYAFPIIKKYNIRVSAMIASGLVGNPGFITWDQLKEMQNSGLVYFVDHSWSHYAASNNLAKVKYEIETARAQIEQNLGQKVELFAYPYGSYNNLEILVLKDDGFLGAFATLGGGYQCDSFIYSLHRIHIGNAPLSAYGF